MLAKEKTKGVVSANGRQGAAIKVIAGGEGAPKRPQRKGGRGKQARPPPPAPRSRRIPVYELLDETRLAAIEAQADWILDKVGIEFRDNDEALELLAGAGARVKGCRVSFEPGLARSLCAQAPKSFELHARDPANTITLGGDNIVLMPGYGSPFVTCLDRGRRYAGIGDFRNFVKLAYLSPWLHHGGGTVCEPTDIAVNKRHLDMMQAHLTLSTKPFMGSVTATSRALDSIEMAAIAFGKEFVATHTVMQANINVNSPLVYDETMAKVLMTYAAAGQCVCVSPAIFAGAMGPLGPAAVAAQTLAEAMAGIALAQIVRPGCPVVFGSFHSTMNLRSGSLGFGSPEAGLVSMALSQLGPRLGVPVRSGGGQITSSCTADGQAMQDSGDAAGWLEGGLVMSYEKFVMDLDHCGAMMTLLQGFEVNEETLARDAYDEAGPGDNFLSTSNTLRHYADANFETAIPEPGPFETWAEAGSQTAERRANVIWKRMLAAYRPPAMDRAVLDALDDFVMERKASMQDEWY